MAKTPEFLARVEELSGLSGIKLNTIAEHAGLSDKPDSNKTWAEQAEAIAIAEFSQQGKPIEAPELPEENAESGETTQEGKAPSALVAYFEGNGIPYCKACGLQHQNLEDGTPVCPESRPNCPRLTEV
ncbi:MAG: hypothetical protein AAFY20_09345 [Cyanobacteria bacterium J06639_14]